jgi:hypothetical protein
VTAAIGRPPASVRRPRRVAAAVVQVGVAASFYAWYSGLRHWVAGSDGAAARNAARVIQIERFVGLFHEAAAQTVVVSSPILRGAAAMYYGTAHFLAPIGALIVLFVVAPERYVRWRNALAATSVVAVATFAVWPLMPPRLLPASFGFVNVASPGIDRPLVPGLYNGYAAMPSLHVAYAAWVLGALWPVARSRWARGALVAHVVLTVAVVVVTANHYVLDAVGGVAVLGLGTWLTRRSHASEREAAWASYGLVGAALVIWLPQGAWAVAAGSLALAALVAALSRCTEAPWIVPTHRVGASKVIYDIGASPCEEVLQLGSLPEARGQA